MNTPKPPSNPEGVQVDLNDVLNTPGIVQFPLPRAQAKAQQNASLNSTNKQPGPSAKEPIPKFAQDLKRDFESEENEVGDEEDDDEREHERDPLWEDPSDEYANTDIDQEERPDTFPIEALSEIISSPVRDWMRHLRIPALLPVICALCAISVALGPGLESTVEQGLDVPEHLCASGSRDRIRKIPGVQRSGASA
jgi:hypothetical protein